MYTILILEDDYEIQTGLRELLEIKGYKVEMAASIEEFKCMKQDFDLYLLDIILPDGTGFDACSRIRESSEAPIIFITSCDDQESVVKGLDMGGDDYITKPFRTAELLSRIQANLRRVSKRILHIESEENVVGNKSAACHMGDLTMYLEEYKVLKGEKEITLTATEFAILKLLVANRGMIVKRDILLERIWDNTGNFV